MALYDTLVWQANHGDAPMVCPMPVAKSAAEMRAEAELRYDAAIPQETLDTIAAQERRERTR